MAARAAAGRIAVLGAVATMLVATGAVATGSPLAGATPSTPTRLVAPRRAVVGSDPGTPGVLVEPLVPARRAVAGAAPRLRWPTKGQGAVLVDGVGFLGRSPGERSVPIASLTKLMTAYVVLRDHPLSATAPGPSVTITPWEVADWQRTVAEDGSNVEVRAGEVLTERQLLEALLLPSADNIADVLGVWDAGSDVAFVAKMNAAAAGLGLGATHYADTSGLDAGSRSDAADQARLAALLLAQPVVRALVRQPSLAYPVVGRIPNLNPALGVDGIVGLKSGLTDAAGGCLVAAAWRDVGGYRALVITVALGQPRQLAGAARAAESLLTQATGDLEPVPVTAPRQLVGWLLAPWSVTPLALEAPAAALRVVGWPGLALTETVRAGRRSTIVGGGPAGTLSVAGPDGLLAAVPLSVG